MLVLNVGNKVIHVTRWYYAFPQPFAVGYYINDLSNSIEVHIFSLYVVIYKN
jgi:hypothetical protein